MKNAKVAVLAASLLILGTGAAEAKEPVLDFSHIGSISYSFGEEFVAPVDSFFKIDGESLSYSVLKAHPEIAKKVLCTLPGISSKQLKYFKDFGLKACPKQAINTEDTSLTVEDVKLNPEAMMERVLVLQKNDKYEKADRLMDKAMELFPNNESIFVFAGSHFTMEGQSKKGQIAYEKALRLDPNDAGVWCELGIIYWNKDRDSKSMKLKAIENYSKAIQLDPKLTLAYKHRASTYEEIGNLEASERDYKTVKSLGGLSHPSLGCIPWVTRLKNSIQYK